LAAAEISAAGQIVYANDRALDLFTETRAGRGAGRLSDLFPPGPGPDLDEAMDHWKVVRPAAERPIAWHIRTQEPGDDGGRLVILRRSDEPQYLGLSVIEMLLGSISPSCTRWPFDGRAIIVEREPATRKWLVATIENAGGGCYGVATIDQALRLLAGDEGLRFAVLDHVTLGSGLESAVGQIRSLRPDVVVVGNSPQDHGQAFARLGVDLFLRRPWRAADLINLLTGKLGNCADCGIPYTFLSFSSAGRAEPACPRSNPAR
jgi:hypothetical protein